MLRNTGHVRCISEAVSLNHFEGITLATKGGSSDVPKLNLMVFSSVVRSLVASLPCSNSSQPTIILPDFSLSTVEHLSRILESGSTSGVPSDSFKQVYEIIDLAKILDVDVSDLRRDVNKKHTENTDSGPGLENNLNEDEINSNTIENTEECSNETDDDLCTNDDTKSLKVKELKAKQKRICRNILSSITRFSAGVEEMKCMECDLMVTRGNVVDHSKQHIMELDDRISTMSDDEKSSETSVDQQKDITESSNYPLVRIHKLERNDFEASESISDFHKLDYIPEIEAPSKDLKVKCEVENEKAYSCQICSKTLSTNLGLWRHYIIEHGDIRKSIATLFNIDNSGEYNCHDCAFEAKSKIGLVTHIAIKHGKLNDVLAMQGYKQLENPKKYDGLKIDTTIKEKDLRIKKEPSHEKTSQKKYSKECQLCKFTSKNTQRLQLHYTSHHFSDELRTICSQVSPNLVCTLCDYKTNKAPPMKLHLASKHQYVNKILTAKGLQTMPRLKKVKLNRKIKTKRSVIDDNLKHRKDNRTAHILDEILNIMNPEDKTDKAKQESTRYLCKRCRKYFPSRSKLVEHKETQHGKQRFQCGKCSSSFTNKYNLKRHIDTVHAHL